MLEKKFLNYNQIEKFLHFICLSNNTIKKNLFFLEKILFEDKNFLDIKNFKHIFVSGFPRSGTTILTRFLYQTNNFGSLKYSDMPFVLSSNLWKKIFKPHPNKILSKRFHGDGIENSLNSVESFDEVFWSTFEKDKNLIEKYIVHVQLILKSEGKNRYLCKNNNLDRINTICEIFPKSIILIPFRDPLQQSNSLLNQHKKFLKFQREDKFVLNYMNWLGHFEFGTNYKIKCEPILYHDPRTINHWIEQWFMTYEKVYKIYLKLNNVKIVCYEQLDFNANNFKYFLNDLSLENKINKFDFVIKNREIKENYDVALINKCNNLYSILKNHEKCVI